MSKHFNKSESLDIGNQRSFDVYKRNSTKHFNFQYSHNPKIASRSPFETTPHRIRMTHFRKNLHLIIFQLHISSDYLRQSQPELHLIKS